MSLNVKEIDRPYRLSDVKRCFGRTADGMILQWFHKGFLSGKMIPRGSMSQLSFSFAEVVHVGVVIDMMRFGLTKASEQTMIYLPAECAATGLSVCGVNEAQCLIELYERWNYDVCLVFKTFDIHIEDPSKRNKRQTSRSIGYALSSWSAVVDIEKWFFEGGLCVEQNKCRPSRSSTIYDIQGNSKVLLYVPYVTTRVATILELPNPWKQQKPTNDKDVFAVISQLGELQDYLTVK